MGSSKMTNCYSLYLLLSSLDGGICKSHAIHGSFTDLDLFILINALGALQFMSPENEVQ